MGPGGGGYGTPLRSQEDNLQATEARRRIPLTPTAEDRPARLQEDREAALTGTTAA